MYNVHVYGTKFQKGTLSYKTILIKHFLQLLVIPSFCTGSQSNFVSIINLLRYLISLTSCTKRQLSYDAIMQGQYMY